MSFDEEDFKKLLKDNSQEVKAVMDSEKEKILQSPKLKILHSVYLVAFWNERPNKKLAFGLYFNEDVLDVLNLEKVNLALKSLIPEELKVNRLLELTSDFSIKSRSSAELDEPTLIGLSNSNKIVFFFGEEGIDIIIRGVIFPRINIFYDEKLRLKYLKKYHITELDLCLADYERFVKEPGINHGFFASKKLVEKLAPSSGPNNTLHNKPEAILRDNLISYLNRNTQHNFLREVELNNKRELDLYTEVETRKYLIEVKWLGRSVNDEETGFTHGYSDGTARKGVTQTLEYIKHLIEDMNYNLHVGYLCVFDAREKNGPVDYKNFTFVAEELEPYYKNHFVKLREIRLTRIA